MKKTKTHVTFRIATSAGGYVNAQIFMTGDFIFVFAVCLVVGTKGLI